MIIFSAVVNHYYDFIFLQNQKPEINIPQKDALKTKPQ